MKGLGAVLKWIVAAIWACQPLLHYWICEGHKMRWPRWRGVIRHGEVDTSRALFASDRRR